MNLTYLHLLIQNQVLGGNPKNRLHCRLSGWSDSCVAGAAWVFNNDNGSADNCADNCANNCANNLQNDDANNDGFRAAVFGSLGSIETKSFADLWDKVYKHFSDVKKASVFDFVPFCILRRGSVTCLDVMKKSRVPINTLRREHLGW